MIVEVDTKILDLPVDINMNQLVFLSMVLDKNQKTYNQDVRKLISDNPVLHPLLKHHCQVL